MTCIKTEADLVEAIDSFLKSSGYRVRREVPSLGQCADLIATQGRWLSIIEAKLYDLKAAATQCAAHEHVADFIFLASIKRSRRSKSIEAIANKGYGLIECDEETGRCSITLAPRRNLNVWRPQRLELGKTLRFFPNG